MDRSRPVLLALLVGSTTTACGIGLWHDTLPGKAGTSIQPGESDGARAGLLARGVAPAYPPARTFAIESAEVGRKSHAAASAPRRGSRQQDAWNTPGEPGVLFPEPNEKLADVLPPAVKWTDPLTTRGVAPSLERPVAVDAGGIPVAWLVVAGCGVLGVFLLWRRRRARRRRQQRETWIPIRWGGPRLVRPHWEYVPERYDSDEFIRRWDSIPLSISGEWGLLLAIAGHAIPRVVLLPDSWRSGAHEASAMGARPAYAWMPDKPADVPRDAPCAETAARETVDAFEQKFPSEPVLPIPDASDAPEAPEVFEEPEVSEEIAAATQAVADPPIEVFTPSPARMALERLQENEPPAIPQPAIEEQAPAPEAGTPFEPDASTPTTMPRDLPPVAITTANDTQAPTDDKAWLANAGALLRSWENTRTPEAEQALWELSRRLSAHARILPPPARAPWLDTVEALAERMAVDAPALSRSDWRAHWVDLRLDRLGAMNGAWRLLELRALHDACVHDEAPAVLQARVRVLQAWARALIGPAAKAKYAEASVLAARLQQAHAAGF